MVTWREVRSALLVLLFSWAALQLGSAAADTAAFDAGWENVLSSGPVKGYASWSQVVELFDRFIQWYPSLLKHISIGKSVEGRDLHVWVVGAHPEGGGSDGVSNATDAGAGGVPEVLLTGEHHAREPLSLTTVVYYVGRLLQNYMRGERYARYVLHNRVIYTLPFVNPDGYVYIEEHPDKARVVRKNRRPTCSNDPALGGVDINRNYDWKWQQDESKKCDEEYSGEAPFSEPETQAIRDLTSNHSFKSAMNFHTFGGFWTHPWNWSGKEELPAWAAGIYEELGSVLDVEVYESAPKSILKYETYGEADDWMLGARNIIAQSPEVGPESGGFYPPKSEAPGTHRSNYRRIMHVVLKSGVELSASYRWHRKKKIRSRNEKPELPKEVREFVANSDVEFARYNLFWTLRRAYGRFARSRVYTVQLTNSGMSGFPSSKIRIMLAGVVEPPGTVTSEGLITPQDIITPNRTAQRLHYAGTKYNSTHDRRRLAMDKRPANGAWPFHGYFNGEYADPPLELQKSGKVPVGERSLGTNMTVDQLVERARDIPAIMEAHVFNETGHRLETRIFVPNDTSDLPSVMFELPSSTLANRSSAILHIVGAPRLGFKKRLPSRQRAARRSLHNEEDQTAEVKPSRIAMCVMEIKDLVPEGESSAEGGGAPTDGGFGEALGKPLPSWLSCHCHAPIELRRLQWHSVPLYVEDLDDKLCRRAAQMMDTWEQLPDIEPRWYEAGVTTAAEVPVVETDTQSLIVQSPNFYGVALILFMIEVICLVQGCCIGCWVYRKDIGDFLGGSTDTAETEKMVDEAVSSAQDCCWRLCCCLAVCFPWKKRRVITPTGGRPSRVSRTVGPQKKWEDLRGGRVVGKPATGRTQVIEITGGDV